MIHNDAFSQEDHDMSQFMLSYEALCLLQWLVDHDAERIKKMIAKGMKSGLKEKIRALRNGGPMAAEEAQYGVIEFFSLLETLFQELDSEDMVQKAVEKNLMPAIDHLDSTACDDSLVQTTVQQVTSTMETHPQANPRELLFKELLKRWRPPKKSAAN